jgi:hypothetical protein
MPSTAWLATHGYIIAPVTIDADDWEFAQVYDDAISRHDEPRRLQVQRISRLYRTDDRLVSARRPCRVRAADRLCHAAA